MENFFERVGHDIVTVGKDIGHVAVEAVEYPAKAEKVFNTITHKYPELKAALVQLVSEGGTLSNDVLKTVAEKGIVISDDVATWNALVAFFLLIKGTVIPAIEQVYGELNADIAGN